MKKLITTFILAAAFLFAAAPAQAQLKWGVKAGLNLTNPSIDGIESGKLKSQAGWFIGPMAEFTLPIIGLGVDGSLLYSQADSKLELDDESETVKQKYIDIPINLKYTIGLGSMASVFFAAGPQFSFNISGDSFQDALEDMGGVLEDGDKADNETMQTSLNLGVGVKLLKKLQIYGGYNFALTDGFSFESVSNQIKGSAKNNMWKVSVAYLF